MSGGDPRAPAGLADLVRATRAHLRKSAWLAASAWFGVLAATGLILAWLAATPEGWRRGSPMPLLLDLALVALAVGASVLLARLLRRRLADARIADGLDGVGGLGRGTVLGTLELGRTLPRGVSPSLARRSEERVVGALPGAPDHLARNLGAAFRKWGRRGGVAFSVAAGVVVVLAVLSPQRARSAWGGLLRPASVLATPTLPPLVVSPGSDSLPRGSEVGLEVQAPGRELLLVRWQFDGEVARRREVPVRNGRAIASLGLLEAPVEYEVSAPDGARSGPFRLVPLDPLLLTDLRVELVFPSHAGMGPRQFRRDIPPLELPAGTRVRFDGRASRTLEGVSLDREGGGSSVELTVEEDRFFGEWRPVESGIYAWSLETGDPEEAAGNPAPLELTVVSDSAPSVELLFPGRDTVLALDRRQPLVIQARDDYGIAGLELIARRVSSAGEVDEPEVEALRPGGIRAAMARPVLDLSSWELLPGDTVRYRVRVTDNAPDPQSAETPEYVLRVPRRSESARAAQEELEAVAELVDSLQAEATRTARETRELERQGVQRRQGPGAEQQTGQRDDSRQASRPSGPDASFQAREDARRALERQEGLVSRTDSVRAELDRIRRALDEGVLADNELRQELEELDALMERAAPEEMREEGRELSEELGEMDARELQDALERMAESQEELQRTVEESLDRFRRAAAEQDFRSTAQEARDLAREEEALADALQEGDRDARRAEQQENLAERSRRLQEQMEGLEERLEGIGEEEARQGVQQARQSSEEATLSMERSAEMLSRDERSAAAGDAAQSAYQDLERAADDLDQARQQMGQRQDEARRQAFRQTASEALALARRQDELREEMSGRDSGRENENGGDQAALLEGLQNLSGNLSESGARESPEGDRVQEALRQARESMEQVLQSVQEPSPDSPSPSAASTEAVESLNQLARSASQSAQSQQGGGQQSEQSSGGQTGDQLQELARQQAGISDQSGAVQSMQLGRASLERQLRQLAAEQGRVGRELGQLSVRPGSDGEVLGDLRSLAREARNLAREMEGGRLDPETVRRQERLFHRLLDAGRSLEKDETSSERESRTAERRQGPELESLTIEDMGGGRFPLPGSDVLRELPPAQRALVIRYFERLNGSGLPAAVEGREGR